MTFAGEVPPPGWFQVCRQCRSIVDYDCMCGDTDAAHFNDLDAAKAACTNTPDASGRALGPVAADGSAGPGYPQNPSETNHEG